MYPPGPASCKVTKVPRASGHGSADPPCGDTWVCQVVIALREIAQATACTAKKRSRLIMNRNVLGAFRQCLWGAIVVANLQHAHRECPLRLGQPCHGHKKLIYMHIANQTLASLYRTLPATITVMTPSPRPLVWGLLRPNRPVCTPIGVFTLVGDMPRGILTAVPQCIFSEPLV